MLNRSGEVSDRTHITAALGMVPGTSPTIVTVDDLIREAMSKFRTARGSKMIHAGGRPMRVRTAAERVLYLPNGQHVKVSTDDSGVATQVEEDEALHAIVRPGTINTKIRRP